MNLPSPFNFAEHLFALNRGRADKLAYIDDRGTLAYGALEDQARRLATALQAAGIAREQRVLLLQLDSSDWPVSFLGCLYAGVVPVAVNTLLTADDYAYMLAHSGAVAALVSGTLLPVLHEAMSKAPHALKQLFVSQPTGALPNSASDLAALDVPPLVHTLTIFGDDTCTEASRQLKARCESRGIRVQIMEPPTPHSTWLTEFTFRGAIPVDDVAADLSAKHSPKDAADGGKA